MQQSENRIKENHKYLAENTEDVDEEGLDEEDI